MMNQNYIRIILFLLFLVLSGQLVGAQTGSQDSGVTAEMRKQANEYFTKADWQNALTSYEKISTLEPNNGSAVIRLGVSNFKLGNYEKAIEIFEKALKTQNPNLNRPVIMYTLAATYAKSNNKAKGLEWLDKSVESGMFQPKQISSDEDLEGLKMEPKFTEILAKAKAITMPCTAKPEFRQLDFWIGEWNVSTPSGQPTGATSSVQLILNECVIFENWNGATMQGKSLNMFNSTTNKWEQHWMDTTGLVSNQIGEFKDGALVYSSERMNGANKVLTRMTFTKINNDTVRQHGERSVDEGKTWTITFDLMYHRKK